jgi:hypothetical protein
VVLADTSVWIDYFREGLPALGERLRRGNVVMHPFVVGELACGSFSNRQSTLELLQQMRSVVARRQRRIEALVRIECAKLDALTQFGAEYELDGRRRVDDGQRLSRSARSRSEATVLPRYAVQPLSRSRVASGVGYSASLRAARIK